MIPIAIYFYFLIKNILTLFGCDTAKRSVRILALAIAILVALPGLNLNGFGTVFVIYFLVSSLFLKNINITIKFIGRRSNHKALRVWNLIHTVQAIPILFTVVMIIFGYQNIHNVVKTEYTVYTDKQFDDGGYRVALVADVHYGITLDYQELLSKCEEISNTNPDVLILGGDIVDDNATFEEMREAFAALSSVKTKYGIFYVYGNHDRQLYSTSPAYTEAELEDTISGFGIKVLRDDIAYIGDDFVILGREDRGYRKAERENITDLLAEIDDDTFVLTVDHQPNEYADNLAAGTDLILSGHTHAGQLWPFNYFMDIIKFNDANYGLYDYGKMTAIVTSGFAGWGFKVKTAAPAEYVIVDIVNN